MSLEDLGRLTVAEALRGPDRELLIRNSAAWLVGFSTACNLDRAHQTAFKMMVDFLEKAALESADLKVTKEPQGMISQDIRK